MIEIEKLERPIEAVGNPAAIAKADIKALAEVIGLLEAMQFRDVSGDEDLVADVFVNPNATVWRQLNIEVDFLQSACFALL
jgi:hypothetical protein